MNKSWNKNEITFLWCDRERECKGDWEWKKIESKRLDCYFWKKNYFKEIKKDIKIFDWKEIIGKGLICTGFEQKGYDWKVLD